MADIKTHLRELSVALIIGLELKGIHYSFEELKDSHSFYRAASAIGIKNIENASNLLDVQFFSGELEDILKNGIKLGKKIVNSKEFCFDKNDTIEWLGNDTQKDDPIDLIIGKYRFSLKEDSFILKNMGLYTLLNNLTGSNYPRGLHVFSTFAKKEYDEWFSTTWRIFINYLNTHGTWTLSKEGNISTAYISGNNVVLEYNGEISYIPKDATTNEEYMASTTSHTREKVFSKWINSELSDNEEYTTIKKKCSTTAGETLSHLIKDNFNSKNVFEFFRIYDFEYYYAKTTSSETIILKVPNKKDFNNVIEFIDCEYEVPSSQLNIISTFRNKVTKAELQFRNECRFSHGQFNGTPEAKMYVVRNTPLTALYNPID